MKTEHRSSGVLLHITCLPSDFGIGDLGPWSYRFVDLLSKSNQHYWSILPITSTSLRFENSPYQSTSAFAGNTLLLSPEMFVQDGLLSEENLRTLKLPFDRVRFNKVTETKEAMIKKAYLNFTKKNENKLSIPLCDFEEFCKENSSWLDDYALFKAAEEQTNKPWYLWPNQLRDRNEHALAQKNEEIKELVDGEKFAQFMFSRQWHLLKEYSQKKGVCIFGDLPFYVSFDSVDVWSHPELFKLDNQKRPKYFGGVPPDYFSKTGQLWGNPVYNWQELEKTHFKWWIDRIQWNLEQCDVLRFDHFRGFTAYWQIPASSTTARNGRWIRSPAKSFFDILKKTFSNLPFVAEDLGLISDRVRENLRFLGVPGMRVLLFAFDCSRDNPNFPVNHQKNSVVYTGTHDTNTARGWFAEEATDEQKERFFSYVGRHVPEVQVSWEFIKLALASKSNLCIIPLQDLLSFGSGARMNHPAKQGGNWEWRVDGEQLNNECFGEFGRLTLEAGR